MTDQAPAPERPGKRNPRSQRRSRSQANAQAIARRDRLKAERLKALSDPDYRRPASVSINEYQVLSGLSTTTIFRRLKDGSIKSIRIAGRRLIPWSEVARLRGE